MSSLVLGTKAFSIQCHSSPHPPSLHSSRKFEKKTKKKNTVQRPNSSNSSYADPSFLVKILHELKFKFSSCLQNYIEEKKIYMINSWYLKKIDATDINVLWKACQVGFFSTQITIFFFFFFFSRSWKATEAGLGWKSKRDPAYSSSGSVAPKLQ